MSRSTYRDAPNPNGIDHNHNLDDIRAEYQDAHPDMPTSCTNCGCDGLWPDRTYFAFVDGPAYCWECPECERVIARCVDQEHGGWVAKPKPVPASEGEAK